MIAQAYSKRKFCDSDASSVESDEAFRQVKEYQARRANQKPYHSDCEEPT